MLNFYLSSVSAIMLTVLYIAFVAFTNGVLRLAFGAPDPETSNLMVAWGIGWVVPSVPLWWLHWKWLRRQFEQASNEEVPWYRFYLFSVVCLNVMAVLVAASIGVSSLISVILGVAGQPAMSLSRAGAAVSAVLLSLLLWWQHWRQLSRWPKPADTT